MKLVLEGFALIEKTKLNVSITAKIPRITIKFTIEINQLEGFDDYDKLLMMKRIHSHNMNEIECKRNNL